MPYIIAFVIFNSLLLYVFSTPDFNISKIDTFFTEGWEKKGALGVLIAILSYVMNSIVDRNIKASFIFWKFKNPMPGHEAFSRYGITDPRVDMKKLEREYGNLPTNQTDQNTLWYSIMKKNEGKQSVIWANQQWLLTRDLTSLSVIFLLLSIPIYYFQAVSFNTVASYYLIMIVIYTLCVISATVNGVSFVTTVLAEESSKKEID